MPIGYLDVPTGADLGTKRELVAAMYAALHEAWPFPDDTRIFINEWPLDGVSQNGLLGSEPARPVLMLHIPEGADLDAKREVLRKIYAAVTSAYDLPDFMIFLQEYPMDRVVENGRMLTDNLERVEAQTAAYAGHVENG